MLFVLILESVTLHLTVLLRKLACGAYVSLMVFVIIIVMVMIAQFIGDDYKCCNPEDGEGVDDDNCNDDISRT